MGYWLPITEQDTRGSTLGGEGGKGSYWETKWLVCRAGCDFRVRQHGTVQKHQRAHTHTQTYIERVKAHRSINIQIVWAHTLKQKQCVNAKKLHNHKTLIARLGKCEPMLLVSLIEVQLVHSVVTHRGITVFLILTQGFVSMAIDSPAAPARTHIYKRRACSPTKKTAS